MCHAVRLAVETFVGLSVGTFGLVGAESRSATSRCVAQQLAHVSASYDTLAVGDAVSVDGILAVDLVGLDALDALVVGLEFGFAPAFAEVFASAFGASTFVA